MGAGGRQGRKEDWSDIAGNPCRTTDLFGLGWLFVSGFERGQRSIGALGDNCRCWYVLADSCGLNGQLKELEMELQQGRGGHLMERGWGWVCCSSPSVQKSCGQRQIAARAPATIPHQNSQRRNEDPPQPRIDQTKSTGDGYRSSRGV